MAMNSAQPWRKDRVAKEGLACEWTGIDARKSSRGQALSRILDLRCWILLESSGSCRGRAYLPMGSNSGFSGQAEETVQKPGWREQR